MLSFVFLFLAHEEVVEQFVISRVEQSYFSLFHPMSVDYALIWICRELAKGSQPAKDNYNVTLISPSHNAAEKSVKHWLVINKGEEERTHSSMGATLKSLITTV